MCGIIGRINFDGSAVDSMSLVAAADSLEHRGPDDSATGMNLAVALHIGGYRFMICQKLVISQ